MAKSAGFSARPKIESVPTSHQVARLCEDLARIVAIIHLRPRERLADGKIVN